MSAINKLTQLLGLTSEEDLEILYVIVSNTKQQMLMYLGVDDLAEELEWILVEVSQIKYLKNGSNHLASETIDVIGNTFKDGDILIDEYGKYLDKWKAMNMKADEIDKSLRKVRVL